MTGTSGSATSSYGYDVSGERVKAVLGGVTTISPTRGYSLEGSTPIKQIYAGSMLVATVKGTGASAAVYTVATDHLTGSNAVSTSAGALEELMDYYPYGSPRLDEKAGSFNEKRKFAGHEYDTETGLSYMVARYYDGGVGRFYGQDPAFWDGSHLMEQLIDPQSWNSYAYARNNPMRHIDVDGLFWTEAWNVVKTVVKTYAPGILMSTASTYVENVTLGLVNVPAPDRPGSDLGATLGNGLAMVTGQAAMSAGGSATAGGIATALVTGGTGAVVAVAGAALGTYGAAVAAKAGVGIIASSGPQLFSTDDNGYGDSSKQSGRVLGQNGTKTNSTTVGKGQGWRVDVENPNPGKRPGQIHYQDSEGNKYIYNVQSQQFQGVSKSQNKQLMGNSEIKQAIQKGLQYLGEK